MEEVKTAICVGVMEITRVNVECPHCGHEIEIPYEEFVNAAGNPFVGDHLGMPVGCPECEVYFELGEFEVQE